MDNVDEKEEEWMMKMMMMLLLMEEGGLKEKRLESERVSFEKWLIISWC